MVSLSRLLPAAGQTLNVTNDDKTVVVKSRPKENKTWSKASQGNIMIAAKSVIGPIPGLNLFRASMPKREFF